MKKGNSDVQIADIRGNWRMEQEGHWIALIAKAQIFIVPVRIEGTRGKEEEAAEEEVVRGQDRKAREVFKYGF